MDQSIQLRATKSSLNVGAWNEGMTLTGVYHNVKYYTDKDNKIHALFGWRPAAFKTLGQFQHAVRKWESEDE